LGIKDDFSKVELFKRRHEMDQAKSGLTRREFVKGASAAVAAITGGNILLSGNAIAPASAEAAIQAPNETVEAQIVVVGSGLGGFSAAITAMEEGAKKVVLLEKEGLFGGGTNFAEVFGKGEATESQARQAAASAFKSSNYVADPMLHYHMSLEEKENTEWLFTKHGVKTESLNTGGGQAGEGSRGRGGMPQDQQVEAGGRGSTGQGDMPAGGPSFYAGGNGASCIATLTPQAKALGVDLRLKTQALSLILKDPYTCIGIRAKTAGGKVIDFKARAVVLATGGMSTNKERLAEYTSVDLEKVIIDGPPSGQDGDGHKMVEATAHGKATHLCVSSMFLNVKGFAYASSLGVCAAMQPTNLWVNQDAIRFTDEGVVSQTVGANKAVEIQGSVYSIMDQDGFNKYTAGGCQNHYSGFADKLVGKPIPGLASEFEKYKKLPDVFYSDTIEELGLKMGLDPAAFKATIETYNGYPKSGADAEWGKKAANIWPIATAPFYGFRLSSGMLNTNGGIRINTNAQVVDPRYKVISGLYAAGIVTSGWEGEVYIGGTCQPVALWCGRRAAKHIVATLL
jgi:fumarate reductase flavoprotein subunit